MTWVMVGARMVNLDRATCVDWTRHDRKPTVETGYQDPVYSVVVYFGGGPGRSEGRVDLAYRCTKEEAELVFRRVQALLQPAIPEDNA